jgi:cob(I)alamin adenosyltransferase
MERESLTIEAIVLDGIHEGWNIHTCGHYVFELLGNLDELVSLLGVVKTHLADSSEKRLIEMTQHDLFLILAEVGKPADKNDSPPEQVAHAHVLKLAELTGVYEQLLEPLGYFIVPGGTIAASLLRYARTITRRAERSALLYQRTQTLNPFIPVYLDRLACLLFQLARSVNQTSKVQEVAPSYYHPSSIKRITTSPPRRTSMARHYMQSNEKDFEKFLNQHAKKLGKIKEKKVREAREQAAGRAAALDAYHTWHKNALAQATQEAPIILDWVAQFTKTPLWGKMLKLSPHTENFQISTATEYECPSPYAFERMEHRCQAFYLDRTGRLSIHHIEKYGKSYPAYTIKLLLEHAAPPAITALALSIEDRTILKIIATALNRDLTEE